jgi:predicted dehydrogenase
LNSLRVEVIGARDFSELDPSKILELIENYDFCWIATKPEIQEIILERLSGFNCNLILEKPLAISEQSWRDVATLIKNSKCRVFYSQPWTFSKVWQRFVGELSELNSPISIEIHKTGQEYRSDFTASQDWLPHDLYLVESLLKKLGIPRNRIVVARGLKPNQTSINIDDKATISISFTASEERQMIWSIVAYHRSKLIIDFHDNSISEYDEEVMVSKETFAGDHPLVNMVEQFMIDIQEPFENEIPIMQEVVANNFRDCELRFS